MIVPHCFPSLAKGIVAPITRRSGVRSTTEKGVISSVFGTITSVPR